MVRVRPFVALAILVGGTLTWASHAAAQRPGPPEVVVVHTFDDGDRIVGEGASAMGEILHARVRNDRRSLVRPRVDFVRELRKSVEAL